MTISLEELATALGAELWGGLPGQRIARVSTIAKASPDALTFAVDETALRAALGSSAAAVLMTRSLAPLAHGSFPLLIVEHPKLAFARAAKMLRKADAPAGIHATAVIAAGVVLGEKLSIGAFAVIEPGAEVGAGTEIGSGVSIGAGVRIGRGCRIYPRVVIYPGVTLGERVVIHAGAVLGADGFGYVRDAATGEYLQFPQQGTLVLEDDVEVGANTTIDRGALDETRIERGVKIDNLVHVGHNVRVGRNVVIAAQTGISGSTVIEESAVIGGQVGIGDHAIVGRQVVLGSGSGVLPHKNLQGAGTVFWGIPAKPLKQYLKELATLTRLAHTSKKVK